MNIKIDPRKDSITLFVVVAVCFVQALAINGLYVPYHFLSGGITGIALLLDYLFGFPTWITIIVLNIPVTILGFKYLRKEFMLFSILATFMLAGAIALTSNFHLSVSEPLVAGIAGAAITGISSAFIVRRDATLGGMDVVSVIVSRKLSIPMGTVNIMYNTVIMCVLGFTKGLDIALISIIAMFISNIVFNYTLQLLSSSNTVFIISDKWEEIAPIVMSELHRGVTYIPAEGAYTGKPRKLVYSVVRTAELAKVKRIVKQIDPNAMVTVIEAKEVHGRGFGLLN